MHLLPMPLFANFSHYDHDVKQMVVDLDRYDKALMAWKEVALAAVRGHVSEADWGEER